MPLSFPTKSLSASIVSHGSLPQKISKKAPGEGHRSRPPTRAIQKAQRSRPSGSSIGHPELAVSSLQLTDMVA